MAWRVGHVDMRPARLPGSSGGCARSASARGWSVLAGSSPRRFVAPTRGRAACVVGPRTRWRRGGRERGAGPAGPAASRTHPPRGRTSTHAGPRSASVYPARGHGCARKGVRADRRRGLERPRPRGEAVSGRVGKWGSEGRRGLERPRPIKAEERKDGAWKGPAPEDEKALGIGDWGFGIRGCTCTAARCAGLGGDDRGCRCAATPGYGPARLRRGEAGEKLCGEEECIEVRKDARREGREDGAWKGPAPEEEGIGHWALVGGHLHRCAVRGGWAAMTGGAAARRPPAMDLRGSAAGEGE
jgi:hypothetical protein